MSAKAVEAASLLLGLSKEFYKDVQENGGRASLLYGFNLTSAEKKRLVDGVKDGWNPKKSTLPSRRTKGTGGVRAFM